MTAAGIDRIMPSIAPPTIDQKSVKAVFNITFYAPDNIIKPTTRPTPALSKFQNEGLLRGKCVRVINLLLYVASIGDDILFLLRLHRRQPTRHHASSAPCCRPESSHLKPSVSPGTTGFRNFAVSMPVKNGILLWRSSNSRSARIAPTCASASI